jgi:hypothetical protein
VGALAELIRTLVSQGRYVVSEHADVRIEQRNFVEWQIAIGTIHGQVIRERPRSQPNPLVEFACELPDGTSFKAVWSLLEASQLAKLVTAHPID